MFDYFTKVLLDDKEVAMIDRMLGGKRGGGCSDYEHLSRVCNLDDSIIRAYVRLGRGVVRLGREMKGHPVSFGGGRVAAAACHIMSILIWRNTDTGMVGSLRETAAQ